MSEPKKYLRGSAKMRSFSNGGETLYFSINIKDFLSSTKDQDNSGHTIEEFADEDGWVNFGQAVKRDNFVDKFGNTHSIWVNEWRPDPDYKKPSSAPSPEDSGEEELPF